MSEPTQIHPSAVVSPKAVLGHGVNVGPFCIIHDRVIIGDRTTVGSHCELGYPTKLSDGSPLRIGSDSTIRSHGVFYEGSEFGDSLVTGHHVTVREMTKAGKNFQIGTKGDIQGHCSIGDYVRTHSNVHIGQKSVIGSFVWMFPDVLLTNDPNPPSETLIGPVVGDFVVICSKATLLPGVKIGEHAVIGAHSLVGIDIEPGMFANGSPAKAICKANMLRMRDNPGIKVYPWNKRFFRGYPETLAENWRV